MKLGATFRSIVTLLAEQAQVNYYALQHNHFTVPHNPTSSDLINIQKSLNSEVRAAQTTNSNGAREMWGNFTLTRTHYNESFATLISNNSMMFTVDLPNPSLTRFYNVRMLDVQAYPYPLVDPTRNIDITLVQQGLTSFYDQNFAEWNYTAPQAMYPFSFDAQSDCPLSKPYYPSQVEYINYSPYGNWLLTVLPYQFSVEYVESISIYFKLQYYDTGSGFAQLWGKYPFDYQRIHSPPCIETTTST